MRSGKVDERAKAAQGRYKWHHDDQGRDESHFHIGQLVYIDRQPWSTSIADKMSVETYPNLLQHSCGPFLAPSTTMHTIIPNQYRIQKYFCRLGIASTLAHVAVRCHSLACLHKQPVVIGEFRQRPWRKATTSQGKANIRGINRRNIPSRISPDTPAMATDGRTWCRGMDTCPVTTRWNYPSTLRNTSWTAIGRM